MPAGTLVSSGALVSPGGQQGVPGIQGIPGPTGPVGPAGDNFPVGTIFAYGSTAAPTGCFLADGSPISRATYQALFTIFGTAFGVGDGVSTFNLPDLRSRMILGQGQGIGLTSRALAATGGEETHVLSVAELAAHAHGVTDPSHLHYADHYHNYNASVLNHAHGVSDPAHSHVYLYKNLETAGAGGQAGSSFANYAESRWASNQGTGIGIYNANFGWTNTEWASQADANKVNTGTAGTGVSIQNAGSNGAHNNMPPFTVLTYMVKASVVGSVSPSAPLADATQPGMLCKVSGLATDYVGGDNSCHALPGSSVRTFGANGLAPGINQRMQIHDNCSYPIGSTTTGQLVTVAPIPWYVSYAPAGCGALVAVYATGQDQFNKCYGVFSLTTTAGANNVSVLTPSAATLVAGLGALDLYFRVAFSPLPSAANQCVYYCGISDGVTTAANSIFLALSWSGSAPAWRGWCQTGNTPTQTPFATSPPPLVFSSTALTFFTLRVSINVTWNSVTFYVNGVNIGTVASGVFSVPRNVYFWIYESTPSAQITMLIDDVFVDYQYVLP